jgi:hypothetical protein
VGRRQLMPADGALHQVRGLEGGWLCVQLCVCVPAVAWAGNRCAGAAVALLCGGAICCAVAVRCCAVPVLAAGRPAFLYGCSSHVALRLTALYRHVLPCSEIAELKRSPPEILQREWKGLAQQLT